MPTLEAMIAETASFLSISLFVIGSLVSLLINVLLVFIIVDFIRTLKTMIPSFDSFRCNTIQISLSFHSGFSRVMEIIEPNRKPILFYLAYLIISYFNLQTGNITLCVMLDSCYFHYLQNYQNNRPVNERKKISKIKFFLYFIFTSFALYSSIKIDKKPLLSRAFVNLIFFSIYQATKKIIDVSGFDVFTDFDPVAKFLFERVNTLLFFLYGAIYLFSDGSLEIVVVGCFYHIGIVKLRLWLDHVDHLAQAGDGIDGLEATKSLWEELIAEVRGEEWGEEIGCILGAPTTPVIDWEGVDLSNQREMGWRSGCESDGTESEEVESNFGSPRTPITSFVDGFVPTVIDWDGVDLSNQREMEWWSECESDGTESEEIESNTGAPTTPITSVSVVGGLVQSLVTDWEGAGLSNPGEKALASECASDGTKSEDIGSNSRAPTTPVTSISVVDGLVQCSVTDGDDVDAIDESKKASRPDCELDGTECEKIESNLGAPSTPITPVVDGLAQSSVTDWEGSDLSDESKKTPALDCASLGMESEEIGSNLGAPTMPIASVVAGLVRYSVTDGEGVDLSDESVKASGSASEWVIIERDQDGGAVVVEEEKEAKEAAVAANLEDVLRSIEKQTIMNEELTKEHVKTME